MNQHAFQDNRVREVVWQDLVKPTRWQIMCELLLPVPWLVLSLVFARAAHATNAAWYIPALACSFVFFLTGLRVVHNAYHFALGISRRATDQIIFILSVLMGWSLHAVKVNHLRHHKHCMSVEDIEAASARMSAWKAILFGPVFPFVLLRHGLRHARPRQRLWIVGEMLTWLAIVTGVLFAIDVAWLRYHVVCMMIGQCLTSFFAVWTVHHDCDRNHVFARTSKSTWKNRLTFNMFLHMEHHLFPAVPTCNLPTLAERLQRAAPELREEDVFCWSDPGSTG